jgi:hypothetical protein
LIQGNTWLPDLTAMGYNDPLPAPSPTVQATLSSIVGLEILSYIQDTDNASLQDKDDNGEHAPLLLSTLDDERLFDTTFSPLSRVLVL